MTIGRVDSEHGTPIHLREHLGSVAFKRTKKGGVTFWVENPNTFMELVRAALEHGASLDLFPEGAEDLRRVGNWRGSLQEFVQAPHLEPYRPRSGDRLKVFSGQYQPNSRRMRTPVFFNEVLAIKK